MDRTIRAWMAGVVAAMASVGTVGCGGGNTCGDGCVEGLSCSKVVDVSDNFGLADASTAATAGTCIALAPGSYGDVILPGGVTLVGDDSFETTVGSVTLRAGAAPTLRGVHVKGEVKLEADVVGALLSHLLVSDAQRGVSAKKGTSFRLEDSKLEASVVAVDAASVQIARTTVADSKGPGIWIECSAGCGCAHPTIAALDGVVLHRNGLAGMVLIGADATAHGLDVLDPHVGPDFRPGSGVTVSQCSSFSGSSLKIDGSESYAMLVDESNVDIGNGDENGIIIINSKGGGFFTQHMTAGQSVKVANATFSSNAGVGIDLGGGSRGIIIINSRVEGTSSTEMVGEGGNASVLVGDGMVWAQGVDAQVKGLAIDKSSRNALLIDGAVGSGSTLAGVTLGAADAAKGIVQQGVSTAAQAPATSGGASVKQEATSPFAMPGAIAPPTAM